MEVNSTISGGSASSSPEYTQVGVCSICHGSVTMPSYWSGTHPPTPTCSSCGAIEKPYSLRVIEMMPAQMNKVKYFL